MMSLSPLKIKSYVKQALRDQPLRQAVRKATESTMVSRQKLLDEIPEWEQARDQAHRIKRQVMNRLDHYLTVFEDHCRQKGIQVHWAADAQQAREIVLDIIRANQVRHIVKSKSLTTEEIHLNAYLQQQGWQPLETDLGEYIIQLNEQTPSHLIIPAIHLSREQIGALFQQKLNVPYTADPVELLTIARGRLRTEFLQADMGISGVNFAVADPGVLCVVENEANAHLTTHLPKIHVAVMGIEKVIPDFSALSVFLKLLAPSATSQKASTYVNLIAGPTATTCGEGPEQVHVILLDNGRSAMLADPQLRETLFCIRCGSCLNHCPVYQHIGGHAYGWIYMGPIGSTLMPQYLGESVGRHAPFLSSLCGACAEVCPVKINIPHHLLKLRGRVVQARKTLLLERWGMYWFSWLVTKPRLYRLLTWFPAKLQQLLPQSRSFLLPGYGKERAFARFDNRGFRNQFYEWKTKSLKEPGKK